MALWEISYQELKWKLKGSSLKGNLILMVNEKGQYRNKQINRGWEENCCLRKWFFLIFYIIIL
jgi:hypothetical protein